MPNSPSQESVIIFHVLEREAELRQHFRLRHEAYLDCAYRHHANSDRLDIDAYDGRSVHLGAFQMTPSGEDLVGGIRMIFPTRETGNANLVRRILKAARSDELRNLSLDRAGLPSLEAFDYSPVLQRHRLDWPDIVEFSRTFCVPTLRRRGIAMSLAHGIHTLGHLAGVRYGIGSCETAISNLYRKLGNDIHTELGEFHYPGVAGAAVAVSVCLQPLPEVAVAKADVITDQLQRHGAYCACATQDDYEGCNCLSVYQRTIEQPRVAIKPILQTR